MHCLVIIEALISNNGIDIRNLYPGQMNER
jgi:hypothetical protein